MDESALRSLIECLNRQSDALHGRDHFWTALLILGCALEVIFVAHEYLDERSDWHRSRTLGFIALPEKPSIRWLLFEMLGIVLVLAGIGGELHVSIRAGQLETRLRDANGNLNASYNDKASAADARSKQLETETQGLQTDAANAKRDMVAAQLALARLTGPVNIVHVSSEGTATPNLSKGLIQQILLKRDVSIKAPILPPLGKEGTAPWTLFLDQDSVGSHQYTFDFMRDVKAYPGLVPNSRASFDFVTDTHGRTTMRGIPIIDMPNSTPPRKKRITLR